MIYHGPRIQSSGITSVEVLEHWYEITIVMRFKKWYRINLVNGAGSLMWNNLLTNVSTKKKSEKPK